MVTLEFYLLIFFGLFFILTIYLPRQRMIRKAGINPIVIPKNDSAQGFIGKFFGLITLLVLLSLLVYAFLPNLKSYLLPADFLEEEIFKWLGLSFLHLSLAIIVVSQIQMKKSWRVGFEPDEKTTLITTGLFRYSRNPIFLGMMLTLLGLFFTLPNAITFSAFLLIYFALQIQVRLEEDYLRKAHGIEFENYSKNTRRWI